MRIYMKEFFRSKLFGLTLIVGCSKLFGLARDVLFASAYGTGILAAAYECASRIPSSLFDIFFGCAIGNAFIPILYRANLKGRGEEFANGIAGIVLTVSGALSMLGMIFSSSVIRFFAQGLSESALDTASLLLTMLFPTLFINSFSYFLIAMLHSMGRFAFPAAIGLSGSLFGIIYLLFSPLAIEGLALVSVFSAALQLVILYLYSARVGYRPRPTLKISREHSKDALYLTLQGALPCSLIPIIELISVSYADRCMSGRGITVFLYANRIFIACAGFFAFIFSSFLLPLLSKSEAEGDGSASCREFSKYALILVLILTPITLAVAIFPEEIVRLVFGRGSFGEEDVRLCAQVLRVTSLAIPFFALSEISTKAYFAKRKCLYPTVCAGITLCFFIVGLQLSPFGARLSDLAFFLSASYVFYGTALFGGLKLKPITNKKIRGELSE